METLKDLEPYVEATLHRFMAKIKRMMYNNKAIDIDIGTWLQLFAFGKALYHIDSTKFANTQQT
jgi:hypothetical protein